MEKTISVDLLEEVVNGLRECDALLVCAQALAASDYGGPLPTALLHISTDLDKHYEQLKGVLYGGSEAAGKED